jgi:hypothetical protein
MGARRAHQGREALNALAVKRRLRQRR